MSITKNKRLLNFSIYSHLEPNQKQFNFESSFISELFYRLLKKYKYQSPYNYISFGFGRDPSVMKGPNIYRKIFAIDLSEFHKIDIEERKWIIFDMVYKGLTLMTDDKESLNTLSLIYEECTKSGLRNSWYLKDKYFRSPDRSKFIGIWCEWKETLIINIHIFAKDKLTLVNKGQYVELPVFGADCIYDFKPRWTSLDKFHVHYDENEVTSASKEIDGIQILM